MRGIFTVLICLALASVLHAQRGGSGAPCASQPPLDAARFTIDQAHSLVGVFRLTFVATSRGVRRTPWRGLLTLQLHDSVHRYRYVNPQIGRFPGERILWGWIDSLEVDSGSAERAASRDPDSPGVEWIGTGLVFGRPDWIDGITTDLAIGHFSPRGFWGRWHSGGGVELLVDSLGRRIPDPQGYFCAVRLDPR
jgi:hypothetical protein